MLDIGGWEIFVILALALIVVGPKDLPVLIRNVGRWVGKARGLANEFKSGMDDAARQADLDEVRKSADISGTLADEGRKIDAAMRNDAPAASKPRASRATEPREAARGVEDDDWAPAQPPSRGPNGGDRRAPGVRDKSADDDDALLAGFQRGARRGE